MSQSNYPPKTLFTKNFHWTAALLCATLAGMIFSVNSWLRIGFDSDIILRELTFGFVFVLMLWWYNLIGYPRLERLLSVRLPRWWSHGLRVLSTLFFSTLLIWLDEWAQFLHPDKNLSGYVLPEYANEFRALITDAFVLLIFFFLEITRRFYQAKTENERLLTETSEARYEVLKQQVNPHFLFNSLNILKTMVKSHDPASEEYVVRLSDLFRAMLLSHQKEKAELQEELVSLDNYFFMLKARFGDKILITNNINPSSGNSTLPPFALQMLAENCVKHNVASADQPLKIELSDDPDWVIMRNNYQPKRSVESSNGVGLENIRQRSLALSGKDIAVEQKDGYFTVKIPKVKP